MQKTLLIQLEKDELHLAEVSQALLSILNTAPPLDTSTTLFLEGELGAGKTTLTGALGKELGVISPMTSPTYAIMNEYTTNHQQWKKVIHMDLYRIDTLWELHEYNLEENLSDPHTLFIVEWSKSAKDFFQATRCFQIDIMLSTPHLRTYNISRLTS